MNSRKLSSFFFMMFLVVLGFTSCKTAKPVQKTLVEEEVKVPFDNFVTDKKYFRATASGYSPDMNVAQKLAITNAKSIIAGNIQSILNEVTVNYINQHAVNAEPDLNAKFEEMTMSVVSQVLTNLVVKESKYFKNKSNGDFRCYVAVEMSKEDAGKQITQRISDKMKEKIDFDRNEFQKIFDKALDENR